MCFHITAFVRSVGKRCCSQPLVGCPQASAVGREAQMGSCPTAPLSPASVCSCLVCYYPHTHAASNATLTPLTGSSAENYSPIFFFFFFCTRLFCCQPAELNGPPEGVRINPDGRGKGETALGRNMGRKSGE